MQVNDIVTYTSQAKEPITFVTPPSPYQNGRLVSLFHENVNHQEQKQWPLPSEQLEGFRDLRIITAKERGASIENEDYPNFREGIRGGRTKSAMNDKVDDTARICFECKTTKTPVWRNGINEESQKVRYCNACGLRKKKKRDTLSLESKADDIANLLEYFYKMSDDKFINFVQI
ncbi:hypothetical protein PHSC3_001432 [Chlamydiales bacterium STE3]|nr:hypothetical protein PHSC3_001432 [Chlamydiales bacterium STE3]